MSETFKSLNGLPATNLGSYISYKVVGMTDPIHHAGPLNDSDKISISVIMAVYRIFFFIFQINLRNQGIVFQHNITEKYYKIGRSKLC